MSSGGGGSGKTETIQKSEPWKGQKNELYKIFGSARGLYNNPETDLSYFPGNTVAPFSPETEQAFAAQTQRAQTGSPLTGQNQQMIGETLGGNYLDAGNPHFQQMADRIRGQVQPNIDARFAVAGAGGSPLANRALGLGLGDAIGSLAYQNYGDERNNQFKASTLAPQAANQDYTDIAKLSEVGAARENQSQQQINEDVARFEFEQLAPWEKLGLYNQFIQGNYGGTTTSTGNAGNAPMGASVLGGALSGAGIGGMVGGPMGAGIGGVGGAGLGILSGLWS